MFKVLRFLKNKGIVRDVTFREGLFWITFQLNYLDWLRFNFEFYFIRVHYTICYRNRQDNLSVFTQKKYFLWIRMNDLDLVEYFIFSLAKDEAFGLKWLAIMASHLFWRLSFCTTDSMFCNTSTTKVKNYRSSDEDIRRAIFLFVHITKLWLKSN